MKQCQELLKSEATGEIYLHCLGNAIKRGITLALKLIQESDYGLGYEANTSTIDLVGELRLLSLKVLKAFFFRFIANYYILLCVFQMIYIL